MIYFVLAVVFLLFTVILYITYSLLKKNENKIKENGIITEGTVSGYPLNRSGYMEEVYITFTDKEGNEKEIAAQPFKLIKGQAIEKGLKLKIVYLEKITLGIKSYDVRVIDERYVEKSNIKAYKVLKSIAILFAIATLTMFAIGIMN